MSKSRLLLDATRNVIRSFKAAPYRPDELEARTHAVASTLQQGKAVDSHRRYLATIESLDEQLREAILGSLELRSALSTCERRLAKAEELDSLDVPSQRSPGRYIRCKIHRRLGYGPCPSCSKEVIP